MSIDDADIADEADDYEVVAPTPFQMRILAMPEDVNLLLEGGRGGGKLLCVDTPIPTPAGWTRLGDIQIGDRVFDEHGVPCRVVSIADDMPRKAYRLRFNDGTCVDACTDHQWVTWTHAEVKRYTRHDKSPAKGLPENWAAAPSRTTQQIVDTFRQGKRGDLNHRIPVTGALQLPPAELAVDPYLLGAWLGDGSSGTGYMTSMDWEVMAHFVAAGFTVEDTEYEGQGRAKTYRIGPVSTDAKTEGRRSAWMRGLQALGVLNNKHVPKQYLRADAAQRMALLQGLMDTDGYADHTRNRVEFCNTNYDIVDAVVELARSLGEKPVVTEGRARLYGKDCGPKWRVVWRPKLCCFRLARKASRLNFAVAQQSRHGHRMIVAAEPIAVKPMRCLTVDSPNSMYLCGKAMIPTHNSECSKFLVIKHAEKYGRRAKILYVRETWDAIEDFENELALMIIRVYGPKVVAHHKTDHTFTWPSGAMLKLSQIATEEDYAKFQGKSYTLIICDEYGARKDIKWVWLLASNMRAKTGIPTRMILLANPGGPQHGHIHTDFLSKSTPWSIFEYREEAWIRAPSTLIDNPHIDRVKYIRKLRMSCGNDDELLKAWLTGDWNINRGAYFAGSLDETVHKIPVAPLAWEQEAKSKIIGATCPHIITRDWHPFIMQDWGSGSPCLTYIGAESPGVTGYPKGSLIIVDELAACDPDDVNVGLNWAPPKLANAVKDFCKPWRVFPAGVGDESYGIDLTLLQTLARLGVYMRLANKERVAGWQLMRKMFVAAKERNGPGLWVSERCWYFWKTVPYLIRDPKYPEDLVTKNVPDHGADAVRYGTMYVGHGAKSGVTEGV